MNQIKHFGRKFIKGTLKFLVGILLLIVTLFISALIALQIPAVQTKVVNKVAESLSQTIGFPISIEGVSIDWLDELVLENLSVKDPREGNMIRISEAVVDFEIISLTKAKFNIDEVILRNGRVNMIRYAPDGMTNMTEFIDIIRELTTPKVRSKKPVPFTIDEVTLQNMYFSYFDRRKLQTTEGFDHNHFSFDSIYASIDGLRSVADTFQLNIKNLRAIENSINLHVYNLSTIFTITKGDMTFDKLVASIGKSYLKEYLRFNYSNINDLSDFSSKIDIIAYLNESYIDFEDLSHFAPELKEFQDRVKFTGFLKGKVEDFMAKDVSMNFGKRSRIDGDLSFDGLPDFNETSIRLMFSSLNIYSEDLSQYVNDHTSNVLKKFGTIKGKGSFQGFPSDFVTYGTFQTDLGYLSSDIKLNENSGKLPEYEGKLITKEFNLGKLLDIPQVVQKIDMNGTVSGSGLTLEEAKLNFDGNIFRIGMYGYDYKNINAKADLKKGYFDGRIQVKDSNLLMSANGKIDLTQFHEVFDIHAEISKARLKQLGLSPNEALLRTKLNLNFKGSNIDSIIGEAKFKETFISYSDKEISIDTLYAQSERENGERTFVLNSNLVSFSASGDFNFTNLYEDIKKLYDEYKINFTNNIKNINKYYSIKKSETKERYYVNFDLNIKNLNALFEIYTPGLYLSENILLNGSFHNGLNSQLNINTRFDTLYYKGNEVYNTEIQVSTSKMADSSNILAVVYLASERQKITDLPGTRNFVFEGIWDQNSIDFSTKVSQEGSDNNIDLKGNLDFLENERLLHFTNSNLNFIGRNWNIQEKNRIYFSENRIRFENFKVQNENELISVNGIVSSNQEEIATIEVQNFNLSYLDGIITENNLEGILNGRVLIKDIYTYLDVSGNVTVNDFSIDGILLGNIKGRSTWDKENQRLIISAELERQKEVTTELKGYIAPKSERGPEEIRLNAYLENADLAIISPLVSYVMSDVSGRVNGNIQVSGTFDNIEISGKAEVSKGKFKIDYLGTTYYFDDNIYLSKNEIGFKKLKLKDEFGNYAIVNGGLTHDGFKEFLVDIRGSSFSLNMLNTTEKDNDLFYGTAFVTGNFEILGPFSNLEIKANAKSNKGTRIFIPISTYGAFEQQEHIRFVARSKGITRNDKEKAIDLSGISLDFNFELNPDAYAEIIFDKRTGDIIRGYGNGNIKITIDTRGDFNMYGNYRIAKGAYNYSLAGLLGQEFTIEPNSSIMWTGDPYGGLLDVKAYVQKKVSITPLLDSSRVALEKGKIHPVKVILDIKGDLLSPTIGLDIDITPTTSIATEIATSFEAEIKRNEQELNRQVFSLLVLGNFSPANSFTGIGGGSTSNVSQLLTNQLSSWLSQVDENLIVDIDLNGLDKEALNTFNLRLSYTFLEGRLRVSRDGSFTNYQNPQQQNLSNIAGEWTVEYLLSQEGKFRLKLYNKNNQNVLLNSLNSGAYTSAGFSLLHTQSFNSLGELLSFKKKKKQQSQEKNTEEPVEEEKNKNTSDSSSSIPPAILPTNNNQ